MIKLAVLIAFIFYFATGVLLFRLGLKSIGGVEEYKKYIKENGQYTDDYVVNVAYVAAAFVFITAWPLFLRRNLKEDEE